MASPKLAAVVIAAAAGALLLLIVVMAGGFATAAQHPPAPPPGSPGGSAGGLKGVPNPAWVPWLVKAGAMCPDITAPLLAAQLDVESGPGNGPPDTWNPNAVSSVGAEGLAQFMPSTWPGYGRDDAGDGDVSPFNPPDAIMAQGRFMCALRSEVVAAAAAGRLPGGDVVQLCLAGYNAGIGAVYRYRGIPPFAETQAYVPQIIRLVSAYTSPAPSGGGPGGPPSGGGGLPAAAMRVAYKQSGLPYCWGGGDDQGPTEGIPDGGSGPGGLSPGCSSQTPGFDCSGLTMYAYFQASGGVVQLPRSADADAHVGQPITRAGMQPGDLIAFSTDGGRFYHHVGIYFGNNMLLNAPQDGQTVSVMPLSGWASETWAIRRVTGPVG